MARETARDTPETAVGENRGDCDTAEVDQCWSVVASMGLWCCHHTLPHATADGLDAPTRSAIFSGHYLGMGSRDMSTISDQYSGRPCDIQLL
jgi:hypothetical protein